MNNQEKRRKFCMSCRNNFYNGNSPLGVKECWSLEGSKCVRRVRVGIWENPPYYRAPVWTLSCHHFDGKDTWLMPDDPRVEKPKSRKKELKK